MTESALSRFLPKFKINAQGCWIWIRAKTKGGYGQLGIGKLPVLAHRLAYEHWVGSIPKGMQVEHSCHDPQICKRPIKCQHRACVNPDHLIVLTSRENILRSGSVAARNARVTHCPKGHPYDEANTYHRKNNLDWRGCRKCTAERARAAQHAWTPEQRKYVNERVRQWRMRRREYQ